MSLRDAWGSVLKSSVRFFLTWDMYQARDELDVVLPSPPLPAKMTTSTSGCASKYASRPRGRTRVGMTASSLPRPVRLSRRLPRRPRGDGRRRPSVDGVGEVAIAEDPL